MDTQRKQIPKSTRLILWVMVVSGIVYFILLKEWVIPTTIATWVAAGLFAVCLSYGLPLSLFISRFIRKPFGAWWKAILAMVLLLVIGTGLGFASAYVHEYLPAFNWTQIEQSPEPLAELVTTLPVGLFSGGVYGRTASGSLYLHSCYWGTCGWSKVDQLPVDTDREGYWSGKCSPALQEPNRFTLKPPAPGKVISSFATRYCGPDYHMDTFFILLNDGSVWSWQTFWSVYVFMQNLTYAAVGGVLAMVWGVIKRKPRPSTVDNAL